MTFRNIEITPTRYFEEPRVQKTQVYRGFSTVDRPVESTRLYDYELIKQDLLNTFNTRKGERIMNPEFGTIIWDMIYEPLTPETKAVIGKEIDTILNSDPRFVPTEIIVNEQEFGILVDITIQVIETNQVQTLSLNFDKNIGLTVQ